LFIGCRRSGREIVKQVNQIPSDLRFALFPESLRKRSDHVPDLRDAFIQGHGPTNSTRFLFGLTGKFTAPVALLDRLWLNRVP